MDKRQNDVIEHLMNSIPEPPSIHDPEQYAATSALLRAGLYLFETLQEAYKTDDLCGTLSKDLDRLSLSIAVLIKWRNKMEQGARLN